MGDGIVRTILTCAAILACVACNQNAATPAAKPDAVAEAQAIQKVEEAQLAALSSKDAAGSTSPYADDAIFIDDHGNASRGKPAIVSAFGPMLADPAMKLDYKPGSKVVSSGGDMAYSTAEFSQTYTDPKTKKVVTTKGTNLSVWRKKSDGSWQLVADSNPASPTG
jgi:uncharacterized protein (TIGR02246 family)